MRRRHRLRVRLEGLGAERLLSTFWRQGIRLWDVRRARRRGLELSISDKDWPAVERAAEQKGFQLTVLKPGLKQKLYEVLKRRCGLCVGLMLGLGLSVLSLQYVWQVDIREAGKYQGEVRLFLAEQGLAPGVPLSRVDQGKLQEQLMWRLPDVKWAWVKKEGVRLTVRLEEGVPARQKTEAGDVVAAEDGIIERITVFSGTALCKAGDAVQKGQVLIRGQETGKDGQVKQVQAAGEIMARIWANKTVRMDTQMLQTTPTGREYTRILYQTPFGVYTFRPEPEYLMADIEHIACPLPGAWLPMTVIHERFMECTGEWVERDVNEVTLEAQKAAEEMLVRAWPETADIDKSIKISMIERGTIEVTASAELVKDIAHHGAIP